MFDSGKDAAARGGIHTIMMGDGSYFDFAAPEATTMTIEDYAYALAYTCRFRGQTRMRLHGNVRVFYSVGEHCWRIAQQMLADGYSRGRALAGLMHESGEVPCGDMSGPAKPLLSEFRALEKRCEAAINRHLGVVIADHALVKHYDLRMLATEKRDLMPAAARHSWDADTRGAEPFPFEIRPLSPDVAAERFLSLYRELTR